MIDRVLELQSSWDFFKQTDLPVILYGTGNGADKVIDEFERLEIKLSGITASDGFVRKRTFRGFEVRSISDIENEFDDFVIALGFGSQLDEVISGIVKLSKRHRLLVPCVPVYGGEILNRTYIEKNKEKLEEIYNILYDEKSKNVFIDFLKFELTGKLNYLFESESDKDEAFEGILKLNGNEVYLDLGAYTGDTVKEFLKYSKNEYRQIIALEPDPRSFGKLSDFLIKKKNTIAINQGIWDNIGAISFNNEGGRSNSVKTDGLKTQVTTVDELSKAYNISYLKADTEGCELKLLEGAVQTLKAQKPKLNIAAYHKTSDLIDLIFKIKEINNEYRIFLRHHKYIPCWDLNLYCI